MTNLDAARAAAAPPGAPALELPQRSEWERARRSLLQARLAVAGLVILVLVTLCAVFAEQLAPYDPNDVAPVNRLKPPGLLGGDPRFPLGTDGLGRDVLSRTLYGARVSLAVGFIAVIISGVLGVALGLLAGYYGGWLDDVIGRIADVQLAFPAILLYIAVLAVLGNGLLNVILILGISRWVVYGRVIRGDTMSVREKEFVQAARTIGTPDRLILWRHILPNTFAPIIVIASFSVAATIITEASLSFLGLGVPPSVPTWGQMLADGREVIRLAWWPATVPGLAIMFTVLGINVVGDWLRDFLDPRLTL